MILIILKIKHAHHSHSAPASFTSVANCINSFFLGDPVKDVTPPVPRRGMMNIRCGGGAGDFPVEAVKYTQATKHEPGEPYIYVLEVTTPILCGGIGAGMID